MPELPEVETVVQGLRKVLEGAVIEQAWVRRPDLRLPFPKGLAGKLKGQTIERIARRAKYVLCHLSKGQVLLIHLGMSGRVKLGKGAIPEGKHAHFVIRTDDGNWACLEDPRRFGAVDLIDQALLSSHPFLAGLGPEPLEKDFDGKMLHKGLARRKGPIKPALMDQKLVAGIGNIYASEALFRAFISPLRPCSSLTLTECKALVRTVKDVLAAAIESGGSSLRDHVRPDGELGYFQHHFAVYAQEGEACPRCRAKARILRIVQAGRSSFYCKRCQR
ncbi:MAG: bifunctional DNA-formamidopyrimidine glycosylase/DNA-(apurinic or apyrimidinic site) lyase [Alphaproteobacteria bacterium]|nr:bifunctional DNA-formamidopyrimidine glycosylase/DNA-(apurinic or apyrimidinic site) lyase [Alphaproteobacteria bacterium]